jgi:hypothetical protein
MNLGARDAFRAGMNYSVLLNTTPATARCAAVRVPRAVTDENKSEGKKLDERILFFRETSLSFYPSIYPSFQLCFALFL